MSEFIIIAPQDYTLVDSVEWMNRTGIALMGFEDMIKTGYFAPLNDALIEAGLMPEGKVLHDIQITNGVDVWAKFDNAE